MWNLFLTSIHTFPVWGTSITDVFSFLRSDGKLQVRPSFWQIVICICNCNSTSVQLAVSHSCLFGGVFVTLLRRPLWKRIWICFVLYIKCVTQSGFVFRNKYIGCFLNFYDPVVNVTDRRKSLMHPLVCAQLNDAEHTHWLNETNNNGRCSCSTEVCSFSLRSVLTKTRDLWDFWRGESQIATVTR